MGMAATPLLELIKGLAIYVSNRKQAKSQHSPRLMLTTLAITLLNPHVYLDTLVIIGGIGGTLGSEEKRWFFIRLSAGLIHLVFWFGLCFEETHPVF